MPIELSRINLDRSQSIPLARQLYMQLHHQILHGFITYKEPLPTTRALSARLDIARGVVVNAYEMLNIDGLVSGFGKGGTQVCYRPLNNINTSAHKNKAILLALSTRGKKIADARQYPITDNALSTKALTPSVPDFSLFPYKRWQRVSKEAVNQAPAWYQREGGIKLLKENLRVYLSQYRGIHIDKLDRLFITTGTQATLSLLTQILTNPGDVALLDKPCWSGAEAAVKQADLKVIYTALDNEGTKIPNKSIKSPSIAIMTPSCQFPTGLAMSATRRDALIRYTAEQHCWLIEDDYAAEYSYSQHPSPSILAHSHAKHIIHVGTMSKLLLPSLRLGWMLVPEHLTEAIKNATNTFGIQPAYMLQQQLGLFMQHGYLSMHLANTRAIYNERRHRCTNYLQHHHKKWLSITPSISGMNHYLKINIERIDIHLLRMNIQKANLGCELYSQDGENGKESYYLLLGHVNLKEEKLAEELDLLANTLKSSEH